MTARRTRRPPPRRRRPRAGARRRRRDRRRRPRRPQTPPAAGPGPCAAAAPATAEKTIRVDAASPRAPRRSPRELAGRASGGRRGAAREQKPSAPAADKAGEGADNDEEALLRKAVPNAAERGHRRGRSRSRATATKSKPAAKPHATPGKPAPEIPQVETAILHFTSVPAGAVVKTKARVLGRTPIALHFKTGNTYEIVLIKRGYEPATRKVAVHNTKDRKLAVTLKKTPPPKHTFFHPHR